jgi:hypothetical protein
MSGAKLILKVIYEKCRRHSEAAGRMRQVAAISAKSAHWLELLPYQYS